MKTVVRIDQSAMNALRWVMQLSCGHDVYVTAKRKPKKKTATCDKCGAG